MLKLSSFFHSSAAAVAGLIFIGTISASAQNAQTPAVDPNFVSSAFPEIETENLFGFTGGSDIGQPGEREIEWQSKLSANRRDGRYRAAEHEVAFGYNPNENIHLEFAMAGVSTDIMNVTGFDNKRFTSLSGVSGELKWLILNRGPASPIGLTFVVEPEYAWLDDGDGAHVRKVAVETKLQADTELVPNRLYLGVNAAYEPEIVHPENGDPTEHESSLSFSAALSYRFFPKLAFGAEVQHKRKYDEGIGFNHFTGDATYVGPSLFWQIAPKNTLTLAWGHQVSGNPKDTLGSSLNLADFSRDIGKLKYEHEF